MSGESQKPPHTNRGVTNEPLVNARSATIDWLTATTDKDTVAIDWFDVFGKYSKYREDWHNRWYSGIKSDHLRWGYSEKQGYILIASGEMAHKVFYDVVPSAKNVTRLDLCVDVELEVSVVDLIDRYYNHVRNETARKYTKITNTTGGKTLYVGSRQSDQMGRIYDKGVETRQLPSGRWYRYEVELKSARSTSISKEMVSRQIKDSQAHASLISTYVHNWFEERKVMPIFDPGQVNDLVVAIGKVITTDQRKVQWLRTQVAPTLAYLVSRGYRDDVEAAIGFTIGEMGKE